MRAPLLALVALAAAAAGLCTAPGPDCPLCLTDTADALGVPGTALSCAPVDPDVAAALGGRVLLTCAGANCSVTAELGIACALGGCTHAHGSLVCAQPRCACPTCEPLVAEILASVGAEPVGVLCAPGGCELQLGEISVPISCDAGACADAPPARPRPAAPAAGYLLLIFTVAAVFPLICAGLELCTRYERYLRLRAVSFSSAAEEIHLGDMETLGDAPLVRGAPIIFDVRVPGRLARIVGAVTANTVVGVLGPSGVGKSTLLGLLAGRYVASNATAEVRSGTTIYVPQQDLIATGVTVYQTLAAAARLSGRRRAVDDYAFINRSISLLGLADVADRNVEHLSGGQRRRVTIGAALVCRPQVLILDEPTSGLDGAAARSLMELLTDVARVGTTIVASLHTPSATVYNNLDYVILLAASEGEGHAVYCGPPAGYNHIDPDVIAEVLATTETRPAPGSEETACEDVVGYAPPHPPHGARCHRQLAVLAVRAVRQVMRLPDQFISHMVAAIALGLLMAIIYRGLGSGWDGLQNRGGFVFVALASGSLTAVTAAMMAVDARPLYCAERANGLYGVFPYAVVTAAVDVLVLRAYPALVFVLLCYHAIGLAPGGEAFFVAVLAAANACTALLCATIAVLVRARNAALKICVLAVLLLMLFGGLLVNGATMPPLFALVRRGSYFAAAFELLMVQQLSGRTTHVAVGGAEVGLGANTVLRTLDLHPERRQADALVLGLTLPVLLGLYGLALWLRSK